jgi:GNAT superfamily N-acetyltransferase
MTADEFVATQFTSLAAWIRTAAAAGVGSHAYERDGVAAQVSPAVPDASLFNSITYRDADALAAALPELESVYAAAGVRAWTVWVHQSDAAATELVREAGYGFPLHLAQRAVGTVPSGAGTLVGVVRAEGRPVCTAQVTIAGEDAGVYTVATIPSARGRGFARRLHYVLLQRARELGARTTTLQASKLGAPVYTALGYQSYGAMNMWERRSPRTSPS